MRQRIDRFINGFNDTRVTCAGESAAHGFTHSVGNGSRTPEAHLCLGRVDVDINFFERNFEKQQSHRENPMWQDCAVAVRKRAPDEAVAHIATVDEKILRVARCASLARGGDVAAHVRHLLLSAADFQQIFQKLRTEDLISALAQIRRWRGAQSLAPVVRQRESDFRMRERVMRNDIRQMVIFCRFRAHKFAPRGRVEKQIAHGNRRAGVSRRVLHVD